MSNNIVDKNLELHSALDAPDVKFYDVRSDPFEIYGLYDPKNQSVFKRLPDELGLNINKGIKTTYLHSSGGRVRFCTDSSYIAIQATCSRITKHARMPLTSITGFDLYEDSVTDGISRYAGTFTPPTDMSGFYEAKLIVGKEKKLRYFTINFPCYSSVETLYVGLQEGAHLGQGAKYKNKRPIVYYGSSITQGACVSRPGNIYQNMISRELGLDYINLGFSANCKAEDNIVEYLSKMDMCVFVSDYDHNAPDPEYLENTHCKMYKTIRAANPDLPYIMLSRPDYDVNADESILRRNVIMDTFRYARAQGDENVYYIDGEGIFHGKYEDSCTVDKIHPTDLGAAFIADSIEATLRRIMLKKSILD